MKSYIILYNHIYIYMYVSISHLGNVACWEVFKIVPTSHGI